MQLELKFFASFREAVGSKTIEREFEDGRSVGAVLETLESEFPDLEFFDDDGEIRGFVRVLKNGRDVEHMDGGDTPLEDGDTLSCFPPVAGGHATRVEKTYRGIPAHLAVTYLVGLGGEEVEEGVVEGDGWRATVEEGSPEKVGPTISLTPVNVDFEGEEEHLEDLIAEFSRKAMRAGG